MGLPQGLPSNGSLFWDGVHGMGCGLRYFGGSVLGSATWGAGSRTGVGAGVGHGWSIVLAIVSVSPVAQAWSAVTSA